MTNETLHRLAWGVAGLGAGLMLGHTLTLIVFFKERIFQWMTS